MLHGDAGSAAMWLVGRRHGERHSPDTVRARHVAIHDRCWEGIRATLNPYCVVMRADASS
jgi:acetyltransferase-like isoleucine patch superfamily enzyme